MKRLALIITILFVDMLRAADFPEAVTSHAWSWNNSANSIARWRADAEMLLLPSGTLIQCSTDLMLGVFKWKSTSRGAVDFGPDADKRKIVFDAAFTSYNASEEKLGNHSIHGQRLRPLAPVELVAYTPEMQQLEAVLISHVWSWADVGQKGGGKWKTRVRFEQGHDLHPDEILPERQWQWWITGPRQIHVQFTWDPKNPRPGFIPDAGADLWFDAKLSRFRGISHNSSEFEKWVVVQGEVGAVRPGKGKAASFAYIQTDANQPRIQVIKEQGPNATEWALTPLDEAIPADIRQNITYLREDLLDEDSGTAAKAKPEAYKLASDYCDKILATLSQREIARVNAGYSAAQANASKRTSTQALEARRNHQMSWPQFSREESQRSALRENENDKADVKKERLKVEWTRRAEQMRAYLDDLYRKLREALR